MRPIPFRFLLGGAALLIAGCGGTKALVPPRVDLLAFERIGLVEFNSNADGSLRAYASQKFIQTVQEAQPGVPVLELGDQKLVLESIKRDAFDPEAIRLIGEKYKVDAVIIGNLEVTEVKPKVDVKQMLTTVALQADVEAALTTRLCETAGGATMWTKSSSWTQTVAHAGVNSNGGFTFGARDPEKAYGELVYNLVYDITGDFRSHWVKQ